MITGTLKTKKAGLDVVFAAGVFDAGPGSLPVWHSSSMRMSKITSRGPYICKTIRVEKDFQSRSKKS